MQKLLTCEAFLAAVLFCMNKKIRDRTAALWALQIAEAAHPEEPALAKQILETVKETVQTTAKSDITTAATLREIAQAEAKMMSPADAAQTLKASASLIAAAGPASWMPAVELREIAVAQANLGHFADALETAATIKDREYQSQAYIIIARKQIQKGALNDAAKTIELGRSDSILMSWFELAKARAKQGNLEGAQSIQAKIERTEQPLDTSIVQQRKEMLRSDRSGRSQRGHRNFEKEFRQTGGFCVATTRDQTSGGR